MTVMMVEVQWLHLIGTRVNPILAARKAAARVVEWGAPALGVWQEAKLEAENLVLAAKLEVKAAGCLRIRREAKRSWASSVFGVLMTVTSQIGQITCPLLINNNTMVTTMDLKIFLQESSPNLPCLSLEHSIPPTFSSLILPFRSMSGREALAEVPVGKVPWVAPELEKAPRVRALVPELVLARVREPVPEQETRWALTWAQNCPMKMGR
jgi:hypothetical protein